MSSLFPNLIFYPSRCLIKTHAEGVVESMGNYIEIHSDIGKKALIHWNGPPLAMP